MNALIFSVNFVVIGIAVFNAVARATFTCTQQGAFPDPESSDCSGFIYCDANLQPNSQQCYSESNGAIKTYFWPEKQICYSYYDCSTGSLPNTDNTNPCDGISRGTVVDKYATTCSSYIQCSTQNFYDPDFGIISIPYAIKYSCSSGTYFRPDQNYCTTDYTCSNYQCQTEGYAPDPATTDCSTFVSCQTYTSWQTGITQLIPFVITCPANTKFSPYLNKCDSLYTCGQSDPHQGVDPCNNYNWQNPFAVNNLQNDCETFFRCQQQLDYHQNYNVVVIESCPTNTFFSPLLGKCYYNHVCNQGCSKDPCRNGDGKYTDFETTDCRTFLECQNDDSTGQTYKPSIDKRYCPYGSLFDPATSFCDRSYVCEAPQLTFCYTDVSTTTAIPTTTTTPASGK